MGQEVNSQPDVGLGDLVAEPVGALGGRGGEVRLGPVERLEQRRHVALVRLLRRREPALVHPVVDQVVRPLTHLVDRGAQCLGVDF